MRGAARCALYWGFVPIMILIGASVGLGALGPLSIPPKWSQSPGHSCLTASICAELKAETSASHAVSIGISLPCLNVTTTPTAEPAPTQFQSNASHFDSFRMVPMFRPRLLGSGPSPSIYIAAFVPENFDKTWTMSALLFSSIDLGALYRSSANCASNARAFAVETCKSMDNLNCVKAFSDAIVSRLWAIIEPAVVTPIAMADNAAIITDIISQKSQNSPSLPRNRVELAAMVLGIVSVIGFFFLIGLLVFVIIQYKKRSS